ncbi:hypothetical protein ACHMWN_03310 [Pedobacter sp. UC225_61]|uniref:hypothetical protein n=1 Tax=Pedobacter sp. UC225_61 TaxID=3374623 RepID=UPI00378A8763
MKKITLTLVVLIFSLGFVFAQSDVISIDLKGTKYTVSKKIPKEIIGEYLYEKKGEPKVVLNADGTGSFQPHMVPPISIKYWIDCDAKGVIRKTEGINGRYQYTLLIQYLDGKNGNYPVNSYDLMGVTVLTDQGQAVIYGERYKALNK